MNRKYKIIFTLEDENEHSTSERVKDLTLYHLMDLDAYGGIKIKELEIEEIKGD